MSIPKVIRKVETQGKKLPIIVGTFHIPEPEQYELVKQFVLSKKPIKIGLEIESGTPRSLPVGELRESVEKTREWLKSKILNWDNSFFSKLAQDAANAGAQVKWLESPYSYNVFNLKRLKRRPEIAKQVLAQNDIPVELQPIALGLSILEAQGQRSQHKSDLAITSSYVRSRVMAHRIMRENWSENDVVIVGAAHAKHLEQILKEKYGREIKVKYLVLPKYQKLLRTGLHGSVMYTRDDKGVLEKEVSAKIPLKKYRKFILDSKLKANRPINLAANVLRKNEINHSVVNGGKTIRIHLENTNIKNVKGQLEKILSQTIDKKNYILQPVIRNSVVKAFDIKFKH